MKSSPMSEPAKEWFHNFVDFFFQTVTPFMSDTNGIENEGQN